MKIWSTKDVIRIFGVFSGLFLVLLLALSQIELEPAFKMLIVDVGMFAIVLAVFIYFLKKKKITWQEFGFDEMKFKWAALSLLLALVVVAVGGFLSNALSSLLGLSSSGNAGALDMVMSDKVWLNLLNLKVGVALLVPFAEELLFRGLLFRYIRQNKSFIFSAILSSALFAAFHFGVEALPFTFLLGFGTAFIYEKTQSMYYPIFIHIAVNSLAANLLFLGSL